MSTPEQNGDSTPSPWARDAEAGPISGAGPGTAPTGYDPVGSGQPPVPAYPPPPGYSGWPGYGGQPVYGGWPGYGVVVRSTNGMAIASLVLAVAGLAMCGIPALVGAILGHVARKQIRRTGEEGDGLALAGIITGWAVFGLSVLAGAAYFGFIAYMASHFQPNDGDFATPQPYPS